MANAFGVTGNQMSRIFGNGVYSSTSINILPPAPEPYVFNPLDLSDCVLWLDANDGSTLQVNQDVSGGNINRVEKWFDKAQPSNQNYYTHKGSQSTSGLYNVHTINQLPVVFFESGTIMDHAQQGYTFDFQDRTFFGVIKPRTDLTDVSGVTPFISVFSGDASGAMTAGFSYDDISGTFQYTMGGGTGVVGFDLSNNPVNNRIILMWVHGSDLSGNTAAFDTSYKSLGLNQAPDYYTSQSQYMLNANDVMSQDVAEIIMYARVLTSQEQIAVLEYLADKWAVSGPGYSYPTNPPIPVEEEEVAPPPEGIFSFNYIIYGVFGEDPTPTWYWCDENQQVESPPVLAYWNGDTAVRDGLASVPDGIFYQ